MSVEWATRPAMVQQPQDWHDPSRLPPFDAPSPPQTAFPGSTSISQRRRSSAANGRPSVPPPSIPIPSLPSDSNLLAPEPAALEVYQDGSLAPAHINGRPMFTNTYTRPAPSPSLSAVASFSQSRQAMTATSSSLSYSTQAYQGSDDLSDPPPGSYFHSATSSPPSSRRAEASAPDNNLLRPDPPEQAGRSGERSEHRPSSRRALTRALALAREAVQLDSTNDNPEAAVQAYARSVALLSEVMDRVRRGEDSTDGRRRRRRSVAAQEDEIRRLQSIVSRLRQNARCIGSLTLPLARHICRSHEYPQYHIQYPSCSLFDHLFVILFNICRFRNVDVPPNVCLPRLRRFPTTPSSKPRIQPYAVYF